MADGTTENIPLGNENGVATAKVENSPPPPNENQIRTLPLPITLDDFDIGVTLGTGSFGRVRFVTHKV
jgi:hypothetical protein